MTEPTCTIREHKTPGFELSTLELGPCWRLECHFPLNEFDRKRADIGHRIESWPHDVRAKLEAEATKYFAAHPERVPRLVSSCVWRGVCALIIHHDKK